MAALLFVMVIIMFHSRQNRHRKYSGSIDDLHDRRFLPVDKSMVLNIKKRMAEEEETKLKSQGMDNDEEVSESSLISFHFILELELEIFLQFSRTLCLRVFYLISMLNNWLLPSSFLSICRLLPLPPNIFAFFVLFRWLVLNLNVFSHV